MKNLTVITGVGFVTPWGNDEKDILKFLLEKDLNKNQTSFLGNLPYNLQHKYRWINECAHLGYNAANLAWNNAVDYSSIVSERWGVYVATALGGMTKTQQQICQGFLKFGPLGISPSHSIHSGYHFTADIIAIEKQIFGPNVTFTSGALASGILLMQAFDAIQLKEVDGIIAVGTEYLDSLALEICGNLGQINKEHFLSGACSLIIQDADLICCDKNVKAYLKAVEYQGISRNQDEISSYFQQQNFIKKALDKAERSPEEIDLIIFTESKECRENDEQWIELEKIFSEELLNDSICLHSEIGSFLGADCTMAVGIGVTCLNHDILLHKKELKKRNVNNVLVLSGNRGIGSLAFVITNKS